MQEFTNKSLDHALLIGIFFHNKEQAPCQLSLRELQALTKTFGIQKCTALPCHLRKMSSANILGSGKLLEIQALIAENEIDLLIFDEEISPTQQKNLEKYFQKPVMDRTQLIIEVFAQRAHTAEAKLQVELVQIQYQMPRLKRLWTHLSRQRSGKGFVKGEGEKQIELDRRILQHRASQLKKEIIQVRAHRKTQRLARQRSTIPTFSIVGYTNAGKSTLLNALTDANILAEDKLFATLDTTTRHYLLPNKQPILLIDTVGFIQKIPPLLVSAFKSTLEEATFTDQIIHVIDASNPNALEQASTTLNILEELGATAPIITVLNKVDLCNTATLHKIRLAYPRCLTISCLTKKGFPELNERLMDALKASRILLTLKVPQSQYQVVSVIMKEGFINSLDYEGDNVILQAEVPIHLQKLFSAYILK